MKNRLFSILLLLSVVAGVQGLKASDDAAPVEAPVENVVDTPVVKGPGVVSRTASKVGSAIAAPFKWVGNKVSQTAAAGKAAGQSVVTSVKGSVDYAKENGIRGMASDAKTFTKEVVLNNKVSAVLGGAAGYGAGSLVATNVKAINNRPWATKVVKAVSTVGGVAYAASHVASKKAKAALAVAAFALNAYNNADLLDELSYDEFV